MNNIYDADFVEMLPESLKQDKAVLAYATAFARQMKETMKQAKQSTIFYYLQELPEAALDIIAQDLKIDWYNQGYEKEKKVRLIETAVKVHKYLGTPYAVNEAVSAIWEGSKIEEWSEYNGEPFMFKLHLQTTDMPLNLESIKRLRREIEHYKNGRSQLEYIYLKAVSNGKIKVAAALNTKVKCTIYPKEG